MKERTANCACGQLSVSVVKEPVSVSLCHCLQCQRRTGSAFGIAAFFDRSDVTIEGKSQRYVRTAQSGFEVVFQFCPDCGSTVLWEAKRKPECVAVAVGCFAEPCFPAPSQAVFEEHQHSWLASAFSARDANTPS